MLCWEPLREEFQMHLLEVESLKTQFKTDDLLINAVDGVSYYIDEGEIIGLVGESGCGKTVSQLSVLQLIPRPAGRIVSGQVRFEGRDLLQFEPHGPEMRSIRGQSESQPARRSNSR